MNTHKRKKMLRKKRMLERLTLAIKVEPVKEKIEEAKVEPVKEKIEEAKVEPVKEKIEEAKVEEEIFAVEQTLAQDNTSDESVKPMKKKKAV